MQSLQRTSLLALGTTYFIFGTGSLAVVGLTEPMANSLHVNLTDITQLVGIFAITFALCAPSVQVVANKFSRKRLIITGLILLSVGLIGSGLAHDYYIVFIFRVFTAVGAAIIGPNASSMGAGLVPSNQTAMALATVFGGMTIATVIGVPLSTWLGDYIGWEAVFILLGAISALTALLIQIVIKDESVGSKVYLTDLFNVVKRPSTRFAMGATLMQMAAQFATYALVSALLTERFNATTSNISFALMLFGLGGIVANIIIARVGDRFSEESILTFSLSLLGVVFTFLIILPQNIYIAMLIMLIWSLLATIFMVPQQKRLIKLVPEQSGLLLAVNASALYLGMSLGASVGAWVWGTLGYSALPIASLLLLILSGYCHFCSVKHSKLESVNN